MNLSEPHRLEINKLVDENIMDFVSNVIPFGRTFTVRHRIDTGSAPPYREPPRRLGPEKTNVIKDKIDTLLEQGIIRPSRSPWAAAIVLAPKPRQPGK